MPVYSDGLTTKPRHALLHPVIYFPDAVKEQPQQYNGGASNSSSWIDHLPGSEFDDWLTSKKIPARWPGF